MGAFSHPFLSSELAFWLTCFAYRRVRRLIESPRLLVVVDCVVDVRHIRFAVGGGDKEPSRCVAFRR